MTTFSYGASSCPTCNGGVDKLTALTDARQQTTSYDYDLASRLAKETDPLNKNTTYAYDAAGNMTSKTDANGTIISYTYDALKRLTGKIYPDAGSETYSYDAAGRILSATNRDISYTYSYNAAGRMINVTDNSGNTLDYEYDILGNRTKATLYKGTADEHVTSYGYDSANRPLTITGVAGTFTYGYNPSNRRTSLVYPNQITASYTYDAVGRVTALNHPGIASFSYSHDNIGNRTSKTASETELYLYDLIYRLTNVTNLQKPESFLYDDVGNRTMGPGANDSGYSYNAGNQITQGRKLGYSYDSNGNQTTKAQTGITDKTWTQTWDYENRLVKVEKAKGAENRTVTFKYDPFGRRIEKQLTTIIDSITKTATWKYVYDGDNIAVEIYTNDAGVTEKTWYTHGANIDEHLAIERNGQYFYYHADGLGSIANITDASRNIVQTYQYDSFGMVKPSTNFRNSYTYTGREWDKETGLYYYRARYYDPMEGRFVSKDPISFAGGDVNLYGYVQNNPVNYIDPPGLFRISVNDPGGRNGSTYGGTITVTGDNGQTVSVPGSSWPNPTNPNPGVTPGSYPGTYSPTGHQGHVPGVRVNNGGPVTTLGPNPAQNGNNYATGVNIHCGFRQNRRGSAGCITIQPDYCQDVWNILRPGEKGTISIQR
jgi:RHS repeat-associated protein